MDQKNLTTPFKLIITDNTVPNKHQTKNNYSAKLTFLFLGIIIPI